MRTVIFDLETSDLEPIGQILNFAFIAVDRGWQPVSELCGRVSISCLQLPRAQALLANRIDVFQHQQQAEWTEAEAMEQIYHFLSGLIEDDSEPLQLVGYNSIRFDLPYLRTSFIRNGLNPYFGGQLRYGDLLYLVRHAACTRPDFPLPRDNSGCLQLTLERISQELGLLVGDQTHDSRDDVVLSIALAEKLANTFQLDVRRFQPYEAQSDLERATVIEVLQPNYEEGERVRRRLQVLHDENNRYALWINLERAANQEGRKALELYNKQTSQLIVGDALSSQDQSTAALVADTLERYKAVSLQNYFKRSVCDIEQDIYRLSFRGLDWLHAAIWSKQPVRVKAPERDAQVLFSRYRIRTYQWGKGHNSKMEQLLRAYALHRYGGELLLRRSIPEDGAGNGYHQTLKGLLEEIGEALSDAENEDRNLLVSLRRWYESSDIYRLAGSDLLSN